MQRKALYALLAILALGLLIYAPSLVRREAPPPAETEPADEPGLTIASLDTSAIRELVIRREPEDLTLARRDGEWRIGDRPAREATVTGLLALLAELEAVRIVAPEAAEEADLASPRAVLDVFSVDEENDITGRTLSLSLRLQPRADEDEPWLARRADEERVFELPAATARRLLPSRAELIP